MTACMSTYIKRLFVALLFVASPAWAAEVQINDLVVGTGAEAVAGARVTVHYTGWTMDGKEFDSSLGRNEPFKFKIGARSVIPGWEMGVQGMRVGGKRELVIPPELAYGKRGYPGAIPPNATLKFEIELLDVSAPARSQSSSSASSPTYSNVSNEELKALLARGVPIVDLRRKDEWDKTGVVEGSNLITAFDARGAFQQDFLEGFAKVAGKNDEVIVICRTGNRTQAISKALSERMGYTKVYNVAEGITRWIKDGNPVVRP